MHVQVCEFLVILFLLNYFKLFYRIKNLGILTIKIEIRSAQTTNNIHITYVQGNRKFAKKLRYVWAFDCCIL